MGQVVDVEFGRKEDLWIGKAQLARVKNRSRRWVEQRVGEGMPSRIDDRGWRIFRLSDVDAWLEERAAKKTKPQATGSTVVNERLVALERRVGELEQQLAKKADRKPAGDPPRDAA